MNIQPIAPILPIPGLNPITPTSLDSTASVGSGATAKSGDDFAKFLKDALGQVNDLQSKANVASLQLATGQVQDLSEAMVAMEKASLSLSLAVSTRDKVIDAYNQVMRMQL